MSYTPPLGSAADFDLSLYIVPGKGFVLSQYTAPLASAADFALTKYPTFNFDFVSTPSGTFFIGFGMRKKLGKPGQPDPLNVKGIYQMRMTKRGKVPIKMKFYVPTNPQTVPQQANRQKFADAMTAWQALTAPEKTAYNKRARNIGLFGRNLFIREYYKQN